MRLGRPYVVALALAILGLGAYLLVPKDGSRETQLSDAQISAMQVAALQRLNFPASFLRFDKGCVSGTCYLVDTPSTQVAASMPGLLRSAGMQPAGQLKAAEPVGALKLAHWSTSSRDPLVIACKTARTSAGAPLSMCQDAGRIGQTLVNVLVTPYLPCRSHTCADPRRAEVIAWSVAFPGNS